MASLPPEIPPASAAVGGAPSVQILYAELETAVPAEAREALSTLAAQLKANDALRISVVAHASSNGDQTSTARRVSLARALAIRAHLIDQGVDNLRINVQAEGNKDPRDAPNRVDMFLLTPAKG
jgi:outer membrane protein OmpA-like peptidoglycan-associated protein